MDVLTPEQRHLNMSRIRGAKTKPETIVRKYLFSHGFRYRMNDKRYPGKPDIVLPTYKTMPKTRQDFWIPKLQKNVEHDKKVYTELREAGWHVIVVWECQIRTKKEQEEFLPALAAEIKYQLS